MYDLLILFLSILIPTHGNINSNLYMNTFGHVKLITLARTGKQYKCKTYE